VIIIFPFLFVVGLMLCLPAYLSSRKRGNESRWFLFSSLPALALWIGLAASGYGAQSLSNIVEVILIIIAAVVMSYMKVLVIDRKFHKPVQTTYTMMAILAVVTFLLRTFMPNLPE